jgi:hypothetical protein
MDCMGDDTTVEALEVIAGLVRGLSRSDAGGVEMGGEEEYVERRRDGLSQL